MCYIIWYYNMMMNWTKYFGLSRIVCYNMLSIGWNEWSRPIDNFASQILYFQWSLKLNRFSPRASVTVSQSYNSWRTRHRWWANIPLYWNKNVCPCVKLSLKVSWILELLPTIHGGGCCLSYKYKINDPLSFIVAFICKLNKFCHFCWCLRGCLVV